MSLLDHARREFQAAGYFDGDRMNQMMMENVIELLEVFSNQGHSGFSAGFAIGLFAKLARYEPLVPLTGADDEWIDRADMSGEPMWQNNRCSHVFKGADGRAYDMDGYVFVEPSGSTYTSRESRKYIEFPYTPKTEFIRVDEDGHRINQ